MNLNFSAPDTILRGLGHTLEFFSPLLPAFAFMQRLDLWLYYKELPCEETPSTGGRLALLLQLGILECCLEQSYRPTGLRERAQPD